jgi:molybdate/tungstate transport system substrate-binding protein
LVISWATACTVLGISSALVAAALPALPAAASSEHRAGGPVDVLYAGSLVNLMEQAVGPAFDGATGYTFSGFSAGSNALASAIRGGTQVGDVFISASPLVNGTLEGSANGNWVSWYAGFASSPLVLGFNKGSKFAADLKSKPWYQVVVEPGFLLGRTDAAIDPKGKLAAQALSQAAGAYAEPALSQLAAGTSGVFPEETLVGRLESGQLDAGFFYASEAAAAGIPTVPLGGVALSAQYPITVLNRAPHDKAARAFLAFLLGKVGRSILGHDGLTLTVPPAVTGRAKSTSGSWGRTWVR